MRYISLAIALFLAVLLFSFASNNKEVLVEEPIIEEPIIEEPTCETPLTSGLLNNKVKGMSFVAPPNQFTENPILPLQQLGVNWLAVLPYAYYHHDKTTIHTFSNGGWWGERPQGICETIQLAHEQGIKVMLKPQLWTHNLWIGDLDYKTEEEWSSFEKNYTAFILAWAAIADSMNAEMLCIGTEIRHFATKRPDYWHQLIDTIRTFYDGKLTYAPNWDDYDKILFWDKLDYIGIDAYFPLLDHKTPSVCDLKTAWAPIVEQLKKISKKWKKPMLFTEFGYLSLDACAHKTWELEKNREQASINQQAQANALQALLEVFAEEEWWAGGFQWKWYPNTHSASGEGHHAKDYTPQGKAAEQVLKVMYAD